MGTYSYMTNRELRNKADQPAGRIRVMVKSGGSLAEGDYQCPECAATGKLSQQFMRPFAVKCQKCGFLMRLPKMKDELKKEKEKEKKKAREA